MSRISANATGDDKNTKNKNIINQKKANRKGHQDKEYEMVLTMALTQYYDTIFQASLRRHGNRLRVL